MKIVNTFRESNLKNYFSIEFEGLQPAVEGVYKSACALKYAISNRNYRIPPDFDWKTLLDEL